MPNSLEGTARQQLLRLQRAAYERLEEEVHRQQNLESLELRRYRKTYEREVRNYKTVSTKEELLAKVSGASIVYCGDFHTLIHSQRTVIRILREILPMERKVCLALELIPDRHERLANDYVRGRISESAFLEGIEYDKIWGFPWSHYRQLFDLARKYHLRMIGLNNAFGDQLPLTARDDLAADRIVQATLRDPDSLIFCLYGDLHIAEAHLPHRVRMRLKKFKTHCKALSIFQNSEKIYWQLAEKGMEQADVVEMSPTKYCVMSAAPWVKWQSYQSWIEDQSDLLGGSEEAEPDYYHLVLSRAKQIAEFLSLRPLELEQFTVYTSNDINIIKALEMYCDACKDAPVPLEALLKEEIIEMGSCFIPDNSVLYLSDLSENRASEKAAQLVSSKLTPQSTYLGQPTHHSELFYRLTLWEAVGYVGSKLMNHKRKSEHYRDLEQQMEQMAGKRLRGWSKDMRLAIKQILLHREYEREKTKKKPRALYRLEPRPLFLAARLLGKIMAERLYEGITQNQVSLDLVRELFSPFSTDDLDRGSRRYFGLIKAIPPIASTKRIERL